MAKKNKFYVVWQGRKTGVYTDWAQCKAQVEGFQGAKFKGYASQQLAQAAYDAGYDLSPLKSSGKSPQKSINPKKPVPRTAALCVDAACSGNPGRMEYRGVELLTGKETFHMKYPQGTNNIGEFLAIVHALALIKKEQLTYAEIYSDSKIAMSWIKQKKCKTKLEPSPLNQTLYEHIQRAEKWLQENQWKMPIKKWDTENWGEIPADFGRK